MEYNHLVQDLIRMHNLRINYYDERIQEVSEIDHNLMILFGEMKDDSKRYRRALVETLKNLGETPEKQTRPVLISNKWQRFLKNLFFKRDRTTILCECEFLEEALQASYRAAINVRTINDGIRQLFVDQQQSLRMAYENIRFLIESHEAPLLFPLEWNQVTARSW